MLRPREGAQLPKRRLTRPLTRAVPFAAMVGVSLPSLAPAGVRHGAGERQKRWAVRSMRPTTPDQITPAIERLCRRIARDARPVYLIVDPLPNGTVDDCFSNVARKITTAGGSQVLGWTIWATPVMVEGEFHAVWRSPIGDLLDVSPRSGGETKILFLPDLSRAYEGKQVNNVRASVYRNDVLVERFIKLSDQIYEVMNHGDRAGLHGMVSVSASEIAPLMMKKEQVGRQMMARKIVPDAPCVCGSNKKLKKCCGS